ncbi:MAG: Signal peptidase-like protein [Cyclobacteriaceae bacterium]|nr:Signal peptidase-like protein [Cyclobacteriaceae bacterium]
MSGCGSCNSTNKSSVNGCKNNGACGTNGCDKLNTFDWLVDMDDLSLDERFDIIEVRFKNGKKDFFRNFNKYPLNNGDPVIVDVPNGHHLGHVALQGELVRLQMMKKKVENDDQIRSVYRLATEKDLQKFEEVSKKAHPTLHRTREIISEQKLSMKLTDVEYQADGTKATFYYSAEDRVDFRQLIKSLASEFKIRVEMRQISLRQEASRLGGIGSCGRELCCSTWLTEFKSVTTTSARYQNLSLNPSKLSGQCGRLKCCLNYELDTYMDALKDIPELKKPLLTSKGEAKLQKTDIFKKIMWFGYENENTWISISADRVKEVIHLNEEGERPATLKEDNIDLKDETSEALNSDLERLDKKFQKRSNNKKRRNNRKSRNRNRNRNKKTNQ